jgi:GTP cyclohydrolase II
VRVHLGDDLCDRLEARDKDCGWPLKDTLARIGEQGGILPLRTLPDNQAPVRRIKEYHRGGRKRRARLGGQRPL